MTTKTITIETAESRIYGKLYQPNDENPHPAVIFSHGFNGSHSDFTEECRLFAEQGYVAFTYDFCGGSLQSKSSGGSTEMTLFTEKQNLLDVFAYIRSLACVDSEKISLFGASQGGCVSALAAEELKERVHALILYYPALCIADDWRKNYPTEADIPDITELWGLPLGAGYFRSIRDLYILESIGAYEGPVLIIHGTADDVVPISYSTRAAKQYAHARLVTLNGEGHGFSPAGAEQARETAAGFLREHT